MEDGNLAYLGSLAIWSALAVVFMIWVWETEPMKFTLENIPCRLPRLVLEKPDLQVTLPKAAPLGKSYAAPEPEAEPDTQRETNEPVSEVVSVETLEERKEQMLHTNPLFAGITGQPGDGESTLGLPFLNDGVDEELHRLLAEQAREAGQYAPLALELRGPSVNYEAATIADPIQIGGGRSTLEVGPDETFIRYLWPIFPGSGSGDIRRTVSQYLPQVQYCYEMRLTETPDLQGKVVMDWTIKAGQVVDVFTIKNLTGDDQLSSCIERQIKHWRFLETTEGNVNWPFLFLCSNC
ncbi:MAG: AgmX/PglI C-terminal domain-containing protein [Proteobacteria bacterium]|nr:AgmX/PglI C-terminal domain-containing protein [Pseudomonadota bacterium]